MGSQRFPGDGIVTVWQNQGRRVAVYAQDFTVPRLVLRSAIHQDCQIKTSRWKAGSADRAQRFRRRAHPGRLRSLAAYGEVFTRNVSRPA